MTHPALGEGAYERNGFRLSDGDGGYRRAAPTLGQDSADVLGGILGLSTLVGLVAGYLPARNASNLAVVDALRDEA